MGLHRKESVVRFPVRSGSSGHRDGSICSQVKKSGLRAAINHLYLSLLCFEERNISLNNKCQKKIIE